MLGVAEEVDVDEFANLEVVRCDVLDDLGKVLGYVPAFRDKLRGGGVYVRWEGRVSVVYAPQ